MRYVRKPFKGSFFYEWQIGPFVFQIKRSDYKCDYCRWFHVWLDPYWKGVTAIQQQLRRN